MSQVATLEEPKAASTVSDLCVLAIRVPLFHHDIIEGARKAAGDKIPGVACDGLGTVPDLRAIALGEPPHEVIEAAWEKIERIEVVVTASGEIITGLADGSPRFEDIRTAIRETVQRVRDSGRVTINRVRSLNVVGNTDGAVNAAAFKALEESVERLGELSQVPIRTRSPFVAGEVGQNKSAPDSTAAETDILTAQQATDLYARLTDTRPDKRRAKRELRGGGKYTITSVLRKAKPIIDKKPLKRKGQYTCPRCDQRMSKKFGPKDLCRDCFVKEHDFLIGDEAD